MAKERVFEIVSKKFGRFTVVVDDGFYEQYAHVNWCISKSMGKFYVVGNVDKKLTRMHRLVLGLTDPKIFVDHINGNTTDNRLQNLRECTQSGNMKNTRLDTKTTLNSTSKYKGVSWHKRAKKWTAMIQNNGENIYLGLHKEELDAAKAYNEAALKYHGEFANINNI